MLKSILFLIAAMLAAALIFLFYPVFFITGKPLLIVNMWNEEVLPRKFRTSLDALKQETGLNPSLIGLKELHASGSAQFSENGLSALLKKIPNKNVTVVDLRQESHGFINGIAVSWYVERDWLNKGKTLSAVIEDENNRLKQVAEYPISILYASRKFPVPVWVRNTNTEEELVSDRSLGYIRIPVTDHLRPTDENVDQFIDFVKSFPKDSLWLHIHCAAGEGRSSTFLVMYDMMRNAQQVKIEDIFLRQYLLGSINFLNETTQDWRKKYVEERKAFLRQFYDYCKQNPHFQKSWEAWLKEQKPADGSQKPGVRKQKLEVIQPSLN
jgi:hypothetical protein